MHYAWIYLLLCLLVGAGAFYFLFWPRLRRRRILRRPFPADWHQLLMDRLHFYARLPPELRKELQDLTTLFLNDKHFVGCAGLQVTMEMKLLIAAQACLLLLNRPTREYPDVRAIYIYPAAFRAVHEVSDELGLVSIESRDLAGEAWESGQVVLAWEDVEESLNIPDDGYNVVLHEFAHQLDHESGIANGAPLLYTAEAYRHWAAVFGREFEKLRHGGEGEVIDSYGATDPAEFFAVATETFFELPQEMFEHHRDLYLQLQNYYRLDPRRWLPAGRSDDPG